MAANALVQSALFKSQQNGQVFSRSLIQHAESFPRRSDCTLTSNYFRSYRRAPLLKISCTSQDDSNLENTNDVSKPTSTSKDDSNLGNTNYVSKPTSTSKKVSTNFRDIFSFSGPAPETINGRLAMFGFVSALAVEIATGRDLLNQLDNGGLRWFTVAAVLFTSASLFPLFQGISVESKSKSFFSSTAETWNGRAAMVGLVALALTEYVKGGPLF